MRRILFCAILLLTNTDAKALLGECVVINDDVNNNSPGDHHGSLDLRTRPSRDAKVLWDMPIGSRLVIYDFYDCDSSSKKCEWVFSTGIVIYGRRPQKWTPTGGLQLAQP